MVSYVLAMREKLAWMAELVQQNLGKAQVQQKAWYDRNARSRELQPGDDVLVLLPSSTKKLFAQWQGPYKVKRKVGKVNYEVEMPGIKEETQTGSAYQPPEEMAHFSGRELSD